MAQNHDTKQWLRAVADYMNLSLSDLALRSGLAASTITRYMNDRSGRLSVTDRSLEKISSYTGIAKNVLPGQRSLPGFGEGEVVQYDVSSTEPLPAWADAAIAAHKQGRPGVHAWIMKSRALDLLGVLPEDVLMIDQNRRPKAGDIVCAQLTDLSTGRTETVMRLYEPPYIVTHSAKAGLSRPELIDDERVIIMGVECGIIRPRH